MPINLPNALTLLRVLIVPLFVYLLTKERFFPAGLVFIAGGISDSLDGFIARRTHTETAFGAALDPVADKLLVLSAYILLYTKGLLPLWLSGVVVLREFVMLSIAAALEGLGRSFVTLPSRPGKITTVFHVSSAAYVLVIADAIGPVPPNILFVVTALITLYSGYGYSRNLIAQGFSGT